MEWALQTSHGREIHFNRNSVLGGWFNRMEAGSQVAFAEEAGENGAQASTVRLIGRQSRRWARVRREA